MESSARAAGDRSAPAAGAVDPLRRPVFVVAPPRAGSRLIAAAARAVPGTWRVADEPGELLVGVPGLEGLLAERGGRLVAADCPPALAGRLRAHLRMRFAARELGGRDSEAEPRPRLVDASPRNALMVPFLRAAFPDATFLYVHRRPIDALAESLAMWRSGRAITHPALPAWTGPPWSFLLVPGWQELSGRPLPEIVVQQWVRTMRALIADLEALPPLVWCVAGHEAVLAAPAVELRRLLGFLGFDRAPAEAAARASAQPAWRGAGEADAERGELTPYLAPVAELAARAGGWIGHARH